MSILVLALFVAGLIGVVAEILVKDPAVLADIAGTPEFALGSKTRRAVSTAPNASNTNEAPLPRTTKAA